MSPEEFHERYPEGALPRLRAMQKAESDIQAVKRKLGLPRDATLIEVMTVIEGLIEVAQMYEGLTR